MAASVHIKALSVDKLSVLCKDTGVTESVEAYKRRVASGGGKARAVKLSPARRSEIAAKAAAARWAKYRQNRKIA